MEINLNQLILYRNFNDFKIKEISFVVNNYDNNHLNNKILKNHLCNDSYDNVDQYLINLLYDSLNHVFKVADENNLKGNLWHTYLTQFLIENENTFTLSCELNPKYDDSIKDIVLNDLKIIKKLYSIDFQKIEKSLGINFRDFINDHNNEKNFSNDLNQNIFILNKKIVNSQNVEDFYEVLREFYKSYGVGIFALNKAFKITGDKNNFLEPIKKTDDIMFSDLVGYNQQKSRIIKNTESFIANGKANNLLLYGDSGTGKSSSIKATLNKFYKDGLRMIDIYKHQFKDIPKLISNLKNRNYFFILYMDDLSFEDYESDYKYLKAVIEGGLENRPSNVLIYATSNRKHLINEKWADRQSYDGDVHKKESMQEKLSLVNRFGETIYYGSPNEENYIKIVKELAKRNSISFDEHEAKLWYRNNGGLSGRTAQQFIINQITNNLDK